MLSTLGAVITSASLRRHNHAHRTVGAVVGSCIMITAARMSYTPWAIKTRHFILGCNFRVS